MVLSDVIVVVAAWPVRMCFNFDSLRLQGAQGLRSVRTFVPQYKKTRQQKC